MAAARLAALTEGMPLEVRHSEECQSEGVFTTAAVEGERVLFTDVPLCWLPEPRQPCNTCGCCGAFLGSAAQILASIADASHSAPLPLPALDVDTARAATPPTVATAAPECAPECENCPRGCTWRRGETRQSQGGDPWQRVQGRLVGPDDRYPGMEQVLMAAELVLRLAAHAGKSWAHGLDALASPAWEHVCSPEDERALPKSSFETLRAALEPERTLHQALFGAAASASSGKSLSGKSLSSKQCATAVNRLDETAVRWLDEHLWSRALGAVARNAIWVQVPNPCVFYTA